MNPFKKWYSLLETKLESVEHLTDFVLVLIILICVALLLRGDRVQKTTFAAYLISP